MWTRSPRDRSVSIITDFRKSVNYYVIDEHAGHRQFLLLPPRLCWSRTGLPSSFGTRFRPSCLNRRSLRARRADLRSRTRSQRRWISRRICRRPINTVVACRNRWRGRHYRGLFKRGQLSRGQLEHDDFALSWLCLCRRLLLHYFLWRHRCG